MRSDKYDYLSSVGVWEYRSVDNTTPLLGGNYEPDAWRKHIPYNDTHDSHIWDWGAKDKDGDGYRDGSVGDSDLWDD